MATRSEVRPGTRSTGGNRVVARLTTETKQAFKTTEFWTMVVIAIGVLIASRVIGDDNGNANGHDAFPAVRAWLYVTILAAAYMVARGLAKAGSRDPYWADGDDLPGGRSREDA
jgi:hypothetical protein